MTARNLHSELSDNSVLVTAETATEHRLKNFDSFIRGDVEAMITTNLLSRSIDVPNVKIVVNFEAPVNVKNQTLDSKSYVQRIGRAGRFGKYNGVM